MAASKSRGHVVINTEECKGCELCIEACPVHVLVLSDKFNARGYHPAAYTGEGCTGCGICFYTCPEPGAITVFKRWDLITETADCPNCGGVYKVFHPDENPDKIICTNCLKPIRDTQ
ncbi:MAG TPA: 4Fe-4S dicluster domain-containing protein [Candidatus Marinimicrobia bacterium]|nr:4Fe-4S dicluster domain-containing protein [Candidatus Neomarinimicrobiota bacterium]